MNLPHNAKARVFRKAESTDTVHIPLILFDESLVVSDKVFVVNDSVVVC